MNNRIWHKVSSLGLSEKEFLENKEVVLLNRLVFLVVIAIVLFMPIEYILNGSFIIPYELLATILFSLTLIFTKLRWFNFAICYTIILSAFLISLAYLAVGGETDGELNLFPVMLLPLLLIKNQRIIIMLSGALLLLFFAVKYDWFMERPFFDVPLETRLSVQPFMNLMTAIFLFLELFYFKRLNIRFSALLQNQKSEIQEKHNQIKDSIKYAQRIQRAILPSDEFLEKVFPKSFVLYLPKDIVAGDFYWCKEVDDIRMIAACDCTGHGVPGAMVSVLCNNALNRAVLEFGLRDPGEILDKTREIVVHELNQNLDKVKDGMDIALCCFKGNTVYYAGAYNPLLLIKGSSNELIEVKANKQPIGSFDRKEPFTTHQINLEKEDCIYLFSDGFADQFGGEKGKKFKAARLRKTFQSIHTKSAQEQKTDLKQIFEDWKKDEEQLDDVCIIGIKV